MERVKGIEPSSRPWEGHILPLNHTRTKGSYLDGFLNPVKRILLFPARLKIKKG